MDIRQCFDVLDLDNNASIDEAKQAYKDMVNIWHPDRFSNNPRLKQKAEDKLKEINEAYETIQSFLSSKKSTQPEKTAYKKAYSESETNPHASTKAESYKSNVETGTKNKTEAFFEIGTGIFLNLFSHLSSAVRRIVADAKAEMYEGKSNQRQTSNGMGGRGRGMGRGKGIGRGGRGGGRGGRRGRGM